MDFLFLVMIMLGLWIGAIVVSIEQLKKGIRRRSILRSALAALAGLIVLCFPYLFARYAVAHSQDELRRASCQSNLKEIALALRMYANDYNDTFPSSAVTGVDEKAFRSTIFGTAAPNTPTPTRATSIFDLIYPYRRNRNLCFCPCDPQHLIRSSTVAPTSYVLKKAINEAWLDPMINARQKTDYRFPADQVVFYERRSNHWGGDSGDLSDARNPRRLGAKCNCVFMDSHAKTQTLTEFEPDYYNWNMKTDKAVRRGEIDPRAYTDRLK